MRRGRALKFKQVPSVLLLHARTEAALFAVFGVDLSLLLPDQVTK